MRKLLLIWLLICSVPLFAQQPTKSTTKRQGQAASAPSKATNTPKKTTAPKAAVTKNPPKPAQATPSKTPAQKTTSKTATPAKAAPVKPTNDIKKLKQEQSSLQQKIKESEAQIKSNKANVSAQLANLATITGQIGVQRRYVNDIKADIDSIDRNINALSTDILFLEDDLAECKRKYARSVMFMYRTRLMQNKLTFIFSAKDFRQMYRRIRYAQEYSKYQHAQGVIIQHKEEAIKSKRDELHAISTKKKGLLAEGKKQQRELETQQDERQAVVDDLNKKQRELQATLNDQKKRSQQLNTRIDQLIQAEIRKAEEKRKAEEARRKAEEKRKAEEARRQAAEAQRKAEAERQQREQAAKKSSRPTAKADSKKAKTSEKTSKTAAATAANASKTPVASGFNAPEDTERKLSSNFAANQGRLPVPISGSYVISAHFGLYSPPGLNGVTLESKGTDYTGKMGAQARCIFDGEVTSVFNLGSMVNVMVRHGSYISVYCNLSSSNVRVGQKVSTRQALGPVARDAGGNATLHFQLRKETAKLNPENWIGK